MKTLVVRLGRRVALNSREPKINRSPRLLEIPFLRHVTLRLSSTLGAHLCRIPPLRGEFKMLIALFIPPLFAIQFQTVIIHLITLEILLKLLACLTHLDFFYYSFLFHSVLAVFRDY